MKRLILTADDFGASLEVNEAVEAAAAAGTLRAASLMTAGSAAGDALRRARRLAGLKVGLHLVLVEGRPTSKPADIPDLVDGEGRFRTDLARLGADIFLRPNVRRQAALEILAQFEAFAAGGLPLDHVNAHKHYHLHPTVAGLILKIGRRFGLKASRAPIEPRAVLRAVDPHGDPGPALATGPWAWAVRARFRAAGVMVADQVFGLAWSGSMTPARLQGLIARLPEGLTEIYLHPAVADRYEGSAPGYRYGVELEALLDPRTAAAIGRSGAVLGAFSDFH